MLKNKTNLELILEIINLGYEIEMYDYNRKFDGYYPDAKPASVSISQARAKARRRISVLMDKGIDIYTYDEAFEHKVNDMLTYTEDDIEYALQFI